MTAPSRFNPRAPCGARRAVQTYLDILASFQSTRPVWGATGTEQYECRPGGVSIHAPRVGRDRRRRQSELDIRRFNPRAPCGARHAITGTLSGGQMFQSTRPVWGATRALYHSTIPHYVSIHAPRVGRDSNWDETTAVTGVSIHAPRVGRDLHFATFEPQDDLFQSTRPVWGATAYSLCPVPSWQFQSTRPVWGATLPIEFAAHCFKFQSTRPVWGATSAVLI